ncbi:MAG: hypothetical protein ACM359_03515 [Bacillota bacterium]
MVRRIGQLLLLCGLVVAGSYGLYRYEKNRSTEARLQEQIKRLEEQRQHLREFVARLTTEKRVAEIVVTDQVKKGDTIEQTTLMFVEYGRDGKQLPPKFFTIKGHCAHLDSLVIKFDRGFIEQNDPLRGQSLVLFYRIFGDYQTPAEAFPIDDPGRAPVAYQGDPKQAAAAREFEAELWQNFWKLANDVKYREEKGVRVAQGESPWTYFYQDRIYTLSLESAGGLSITSRPMEGIWAELREALKRQR